MEEKGATGAPSLPKGGGAIQGIGETFQPNLFSGTGNFSVRNKGVRTLFPVRNLRSSISRSS